MVVNYESAGLLGDLATSLQAQEFEVDGRAGTLEVIVVDNASRRDDDAALSALAAQGVRLVRNTENVGYAIANNQGLHVARGRYHLVSNPDVRVGPGCIGSLIAALEGAGGEAVVGPLASIDGEAQVFLPPNELPDPWLEAVVQAGRHEAAIARYHCRRRSRHAHAFWTAEAPMALSMLSGGFFLGLRESFLDHGLFDPGYPLYYEDTDLFRRLRWKGVQLLHVPAARIVHLFSRSANLRMNAAMYRNRIGAARYFARWFGEAGGRARDHALDRADRRGADHECPWPLEEITPGAASPVLEVPDVPGAYLEFAGNARFSLAAGIFPEAAGAFTLPSAFWNDLAPVRYWARAVDPRTGDTLRAWSMQR